ncbi:MAG: SDR family oxidoreductase [Alphaproteobacteria bacterium]|nr:SDR family oxidoreductase [Alphaproteobacteria bacterium]
MSMDGRRVVVTAGGSGIGQVIASYFVDAGAKVAICDIDPACATGGTSGDRLRGWEADVGNAQSAGRFMQVAIDWLGGIDVLVNNAGVSGPTKPVEDISVAEWCHTIDVNVNGQFYCARMAIPLMKAQRSGVILNLSSVAGKMGMPRRSVYSVSKYAVRGFTDVLAVELGEYNIRVNSLLPGVVNGARVRRVIAEQAAAAGLSLAQYWPRVLHNVSMHTAVDAEDVAAMALFLASDQARFISGQSIGVCGNFESYRGPIVLGDDA